MFRALSVRLLSRGFSSTSVVRNRAVPPVVDAAEQSSKKLWFYKNEEFGKHNQYSFYDEEAQLMRFRKKQPAAVRSSQIPWKSEPAAKSTTSTSNVYKTKVFMQQQGFYDPTTAEGQNSPTPGGFLNPTPEPTTTTANATVDFQSQVGKLVWEEGKQQAKRVLDIYRHLDFLKPLFDVEPKTIFRRLFDSLRPVPPFALPSHPDIYGPLMIIFSLAAVLLLEMKTNNHTLREGTLMGEALGLCFGYWLLFSTASFLISYLCTLPITLVQILSLTGYGLFGHTIVLLAGIVFHTAHDHVLFYIISALIVFPSTLKMVGTVVRSASRPEHRLGIGIFMPVIHVFFLLYLHFGFHQA